jgi:hypothetical protein
MKTISTDPEVFESTYALIMRSEEKQRSRLEIQVYSLLIINTVFAFSQLSREARTMPPNIARNSTTVSATAHHGT